MGEIMSKEVRAALNDPIKRHLIIDVYLRRRRAEIEPYQELVRRREEDALRREKPAAKPDPTTP